MPGGSLQPLPPKPQPEPAAGAQAWSINGAKRAQRVATRRKRRLRENRSSRRFGNHWQPTATDHLLMVRRGSTVRVRQRALQNTCSARFRVTFDLRFVVFAVGVEHVVEQSASKPR